MRWKGCYCHLLSCTDDICPHRCGEAVIWWKRVPSRTGLCPLVRGNRRTAPPDLQPGRSIPAHAGKPPASVFPTKPTWVYSRPCGEATLALMVWNCVARLSPPTRGSREWGSEELDHIGSIPAHAGKPIFVPVRLIIMRVYPRPRGEAGVAAARDEGVDGLSPPTRGSPPRIGGQLDQPRSIPAHAGKPPSLWPRCSPSTVYPRPRGEADIVQPKSRTAKGLSPPTRGSRRRSPERRAWERSIPAHAGKPMPRSPGRRLPGVYPRPRGEAFKQATGVIAENGLSPPTRGSLASFRARIVALRSIPAHAGKPVWRDWRYGAAWVYPRPRGEAGVASSPSSRALGLSPPTRGSLVCGHA